MMKHFLLIGGTGVGKSSTINALAQKNNMAKVGYGSEPKTQKLMGYRARGYVLWDTPGLGEGISEDERHINNIVSLSVDNPKYQIDHVFLVIEAKKRDFGGVYKVIENLIRSRHEDNFSVLMNQADQAMKGQNWNAEENLPKPKLLEFLKEQAVSAKSRIMRNTGVVVSIPEFYSALTGYKVSEVHEHIVAISQCR